MYNMIMFIVVGAGVLQLPLIMDVIQYLFPRSRIGRAVTHVMRVVLMISMVFSVTAAVYMHFSVLLLEHTNSYAAAEPSLNFSAILHGIFSLWDYVMLLNHFADASMQHPSRIRRVKPSTGSILVAPASHVDDAHDDDDALMCTECRVPKLLRTHHCRICGTCIELMDHHCPYLGTCVGLTSFRSFYLWVCYGTLGISYATYISFWSFKYCWYDGLNPRGASAAEKTIYRDAWRGEHGALCTRMGSGAYLFLPAFFGWLSTMFIFLFQTALLRADMTTIEYLKGLTQMKVRIRAPEEVKHDEERRRKRQEAGGGGLARFKRKNASSTASTGAEQAAHFEDDDSVEEDHALLVDQGPDIGLLEAGSPIAMAFQAAASASATLGSTVEGATSFAYNPHKSFRRLVLQRKPVWTLFCPPILEATVQSLLQKRTMKSDS
jgi:hypothetical protein